MNYGIDGVMDNKYSKFAVASVIGIFAAQLISTLINNIPVGHPILTSPGPFQGVKYFTLSLLSWLRLLLPLLAISFGAKGLIDYNKDNSKGGKIFSIISIIIGSFVFIINLIATYVALTIPW